MNFRSRTIQSVVAPNERDLIRRRREKY